MREGLGGRVIGGGEVLLLVVTGTIHAVTTTRATALEPIAILLVLVGTLVEVIDHLANTTLSRLSNKREKRPPLYQKSITPLQKEGLFITIPAGSFSCLLHPCNAYKFSDVVHPTPTWSASYHD